MSVLERLNTGICAESRQPGGKVSRGGWRFGLAEISPKGLDFPLIWGFSGKSETPHPLPRGEGKTAANQYIYVAANIQVKFSTFTLGQSFGAVPQDIMHGTSEWFSTIRFFIANRTGETGETGGVWHE